MTLQTCTGIDLRFDQYGDYNSQGYLVNSLEACKPMLDHIKAQGYGSVTLLTNVPIDLNTGKICTYDPNTWANVADKSLPKDFWKIAEYSKSIGLDTVVRAHPVNYINDNAIANWSEFGPNFSLKEFFNSLLTYETTMAVQAQAAGVSTFYVGFMQGGFDGADHLSYWQAITDSIRKVFSGKLAYAGSYAWDSAVWGLVDEVHVIFDPELSHNPISDVKSIIQKYSSPDTDVSHPADVIQAIKIIHDKFNKPVFLDDVRFDAGSNGLGNFSDYFGLANSGIIPAGEPNIPLLTARITAFFELLRSELNDSIGGFDSREYMPWMQSTSIRNPTDNFGQAYNKLSSLGFDLYNQPQTEALYRHFIDGFQSSIQGTSANDNIWVYTGTHSIDGGVGTDTLDLKVAKFVDSKISPSGGSYNINWNHGSDQISNVERIQFEDTNVALDISGTAGEAYRIYKAAFDRAPDTGGLGFWISAMDHGSSLTSVAAGFIASPEFQKLYGANVSDRDYVTKLYNNVLDRNPDQGGYDFWLGALANGATRQDILVNFSESKENIANVADLIANGIQYQEWLG